MLNGRAWTTLVLATVCATLSAQSPLPDFSGVWRIDDVQSGRGVDVWGQTRARVIVITQTPSEFTLETDGGGPNVPGDLQRYRLDGDELVMRDDSLGELPNFVRKVRTLALWDGQALKTETETVSESIDARTGAPKTGRGITSVLTFRLGADPNELIVERTGFRAQPPSLLHGQPYDRKTDLAYNIDRVRYLKMTTTR
jgi:hypothetical protein